MWHERFCIETSEHSCYVPIVQQRCKQSWWTARWWIAICQSSASETNAGEWFLVPMAGRLSSSFKSDATHQNILSFVREKTVLVHFDKRKHIESSLSKSKTSQTLQISNYEAGVLFLPKFVTNTEYISIDDSDHSTPVFPLLYDIPLTKYVVDDKPFLCENMERKHRVRRIIWFEINIINTVMKSYATESNRKIILFIPIKIHIWSTKYRSRCCYKNSGHFVHTPFDRPRQKQLK